MGKCKCGRKDCHKCCKDPCDLKCKRGHRGDPGDDGRQGNPGVTGDVGPTGDKGDKGDCCGLKGEQGDIGITGPPAPEQLPGPTGNAGDTGDSGDNGDEGPKGQKGQSCKGDPGLTGDKGPPGNDGLDNQGSGSLVGFSSNTPPPFLFAPLPTNITITSGDTGGLDGLLVGACSSFANPLDITTFNTIVGLFNGTPPNIAMSMPRDGVINALAVFGNITSITGIDSLPDDTIVKITAQLYEGHTGHEHIGNTGDTGGYTGDVFHPVDGALVELEYTVIGGVLNNVQDRKIITPNVPVTVINRYLMVFRFSVPEDGPLFNVNLSATGFFSGGINIVNPIPDLQRRGRK